MTTIICLQLSKVTIIFVLFFNPYLIAILPILTLFNSSLHDKPYDFATGKHSQEEFIFRFSTHVISVIVSILNNVHH